MEHDAGVAVVGGVVVGPQGARQACPLLLQDAVGGFVASDVLVSLDGNRSPDQGQLYGYSYSLAPR